MDKLTTRHAQLTRAIKSLEDVIKSFEDIQARSGSSTDDSYEREYKIHRDSVVQRFEYNIDLLWKYIKQYLESRHAIIDINISGDVVREAYTARIITEHEGETILEMIKMRNRTSHMYVEELADQLMRQIRVFYIAINNVAQKLAPKKT